MTVNDEWWRDISPHENVSYEHARHDAAKTRKEADFLLGLLGPPAGGRLLDVPCGTGRHSIELARRGYEMTAVNVTSAMLDKAQRESDERDLSINWENRDIRDLPWEDHFDGAFCFFGTFGFFDERGNADFIRAVHRTLRTGATFVLETHVAETLLPRFQRRWWVEVGDALLLQEREYDHVAGRINTEWILMRDDQRTVRHSSIRLYPFAELWRLVEEQGFTYVGSYDTSTGEPFQFGAARLTLVLAKE